MDKRISSHDKILQAALVLIRTHGYEATSVDAICDRAGVSKGSFFHYFKSKEQLAIAAAAYFNQMAEQLFSTAAFTQLEDPLERVMGYLDLRQSLLIGELPDYTCLLGTMVQETYTSHPAIREACERYLSEHAASRTHDIVAAKQRYAPQAEWDAEELAFFIQATLQGAFIMAKAKADVDIAKMCLVHLRTYIASLFSRTLASQGV